MCTGAFYCRSLLTFNATCLELIDFCRMMMLFDQNGGLIKYSYTKAPLRPAAYVAHSIMIAEGEIAIDRSLSLISLQIRVSAQTAHT